MRLGGYDLATEPIAAKQLCGFVPDRPHVYEKLTGAEFLRFVAGLYGQDGKTVELVGIYDNGERQPSPRTK